MAEIHSVVSWLALMTPILVILCSSAKILSLVASGSRLRAHMAGVNKANVEHRGQAAKSAVVELFFVFQQF